MIPENVATTRPRLRLNSFIEARFWDSDISFLSKHRRYGDFPRQTGDAK